MRKTAGWWRSWTTLLGACTLLLGAAAGRAEAASADSPTSLQVSWLTTCMTGQMQISVNGVLVSTLDIQQGDSTCNGQDYERTVTLTDKETLAAMDTMACNVYTAKFTGTGGTRFLGYVRANAVYSVSGTNVVCVVDTLYPAGGSAGCVFRDLTNHLITISDGASYSNVLLDANNNGTADCREAGFDADGDGVPNATDNCPYRFNPDQADADGDLVGDVCDNCVALANANQSDVDHDAIGDACDNCINVANPSQSDCNHNSVGDLCELAYANQDLDSDGVCNGVDNCPAVANPDQTDSNNNGIGNACDVMAVTVPASSSDPTAPHVTYANHVTTLKGIARNGANQYYWHFGDSTPDMAWTAIGNSYNLGVTHTYTGQEGQTYTAVLHVRNSGSPLTETTANYPIVYHDVSAALLNPPDTNAVDYKAKAAVDEALWYLHTNMNRPTSAAGPPYYSQPYGNWSQFVDTCPAIDAMELHGSKPTGDFTNDPYVEDVQRGMNYVLAQYKASYLTAQGPAGINNPDSNHNGMGLTAMGYGSISQTYMDNICNVAIASSGAPSYVSPVGNFGVYQRKLSDVVQDMVDYWAWGQNDSTSGGNGRGSWWYYANSNNAGDGSTAQWPVLTMIAAQKGMGATVPSFVGTELMNWWTYSHNTTPGSNDCGGWGYSNPTQLVNTAKTSAGIGEASFMGIPQTDARVKGALGFLYRRWNDFDGSWNSNLGYAYSEYGIMKAMSLWDTTPTIADYSCDGASGGTNSFDWYYSTDPNHKGLATDILGRQASNGSWTSNPGYQDVNVATGWDALILQKGVATIKPTATICNCTGGFYTYPPTNYPFALSGACSSDADPLRTITKYEWDFAFNPTAGFGANKAIPTGVTVTDPGYASVGTYSAALRVTDDNNQTNIFVCPVTVTKDPICPQPDAGPDTTHVYAGYIGVAVNFTALASVDPDGDVLTYNWSLNGNGVFGDSTSATPSYTYNVPGTYNVAVQVSDASCTRTAFAKVVVGNHAPVSNPGGPYTGLIGSTITLDGSGSNDPDPGDAITYSWDLNADGNFGDSSLIKPSFVVSSVAGTKQSVCLKVTDKAGLSSTRCSSVTAVNIQPPHCVSASTPAQSCGTQVLFNLDGTGSTDPQGLPLTYSWTLVKCDAGSLSLSSSTSAQPTATLSPGMLKSCSDNCTVQLTVNNGTVSNTCSPLTTLTVNDVTPPTINCPTAVSTECTGAGTAFADPGTATVTDNCSSPTVTGPVAATFSTGTTKTTFTATDGCGLTATCNSSVTVTDKTAPTISCPNPLTVECTGNSSATVTPPVVTANDVCDGILTATGPAAGSYPLGVTTTSYQVADKSGNANSCPWTITVQDQTAPSITCPAPATVECTGQRQAQVTPATATASDTCSPVTITSPLAASFVMGTTTTNYSVVDSSGNTNACTSSITVQDTTKPSITCPADLILEATGAGGVIGIAAGAAVATDTCGSVSTVDPAVGNYPIGSTPVTHTATDQAGNVNSCTHAITVRDSTPPSLTVPASITQEATGASGAMVTFAVTATDIVDGATATTCSPLSGTTFAIGSTTVTCTSTDAHGNVGTKSFAVNVVDTTPPQVTVPANISAEATAAGGNVVDYATSATDIVDGTTTVVCSPASGSTFAITTTTVNCTSTDAHGNVGSASFTVAIVDTTPPALTLPTNIVVEATAPAGNVVNFTALANDIVDGQTLTNCTPASGSTFAITATTVTCTSTDKHNNTATGTFLVTVADTIKPVVTLDPNNLLPVYTNVPSQSLNGLATDSGSGVASAQFVVTSNGVGNDGITTTTNYGPLVPDGSNQVSAAATLLEGVNNVVLQATDKAGNTNATGSIKVIVDTVKPVLTITSPSDNSASGTSSLGMSFNLVDRTPTTVVVTANGQGAQSFSFPSGNVSGQLANITGLNPGNNTLVVTATDSAGNVGTAQIVVLVDLSAPVLHIMTPPDGSKFGPQPGNLLPYTLSVDDISANTVVPSFGGTYGVARGGGLVQGSLPLVEGLNSFSFLSTNEVGRTATTGATITYDVTAPTGSFVTPSANAFVRGSLKLSANATDNLTGVASVTFQIDNQAPISAAATQLNGWGAANGVSTSGMNDGAHTLTATLVDGVGNSSVITETFIVDNTPPVGVITGPAANSYLRNTITIGATATDATSGVASIVLAVNGTNIGAACVSSPCSVSFDTTTLPDGPFTISETVTDNAGNVSVTQLTATADNHQPALFITSPTNGQVLTTSMTVSTNVVDTYFKSVECFVDGVSLGVSTSKTFTTSYSLLSKMDGDVNVTCTETDLAGGVVSQTVTPTVKNWTERMRPQHLNLCEHDPYVSMAVLNIDPKGTNVNLLLPIAGKNLTFQIAGVTAVPVIKAIAPGHGDDDDEGEDHDNDDHAKRRVILKVSTKAFTDALKAAIATHSIDTSKPVTIKLYSGTHYIGSDTIVVRSCDKDDHCDDGHDH